MCITFFLITLSHFSISLMVPWFCAAPVGNEISLKYWAKRAPRICSENLYLKWKLQISKALLGESRIHGFSIWTRVIYLSYYTWAWIRQFCYMSYTKCVILLTILEVIVRIVAYTYIRFPISSGTFRRRSSSQESHGAMSPCRVW